MRKPFFFKQKQCWYVKGSAQEFIRLHPDEDRAYEIWHDMQSAGQDSGPRSTVRGIGNSFFEAKGSTFSSDRLHTLQRYYWLFCKQVGGVAVEVTESQLIDWSKSPKPSKQKPKEGEEQKTVTWGPSTRRHAVSIVKRVYAWAFNQGKITKNPIADVPLEESGIREETIDLELHRKLVRSVLDGESHRSFALYLIASRCGARPQQIREVTAKHVQGPTWVFQKHKTSDKTKKHLTVYLSPCLQTITEILASRYPDGPLFRNGDNQPWKKDTIVHRMNRLKNRLGVPKNVVVYSYRHTFATDSLIAGNPIAVVAQLLGHKDTRMVSKVYGHLEKHQQHLLDAVLATSTIQNERSSQKQE